MSPVACAATLAGTIVAAYLIASAGAGIVPGLAVACGLLSGLALHRAVREPDASGSAGLSWIWGSVVAAVFGGLLAVAWPQLLPAGGASDLTHHLMLMDVLERTGHLVDGIGREGDLGEMAHYTPGVHLLTVIAAALTGTVADRAAYPVLAAVIALKAGFVFLIAADGLAGLRARVPLALTAVVLVLFAPRAYTLDGFLQAGFYAQVASELFVVAGWWGLARWWRAPAAAWMAFVGWMAAATFLVWPIWIGPLGVAVGVALLAMTRLSWTDRLRHGALAAAPVAVVAAIHLVQHAAWLRIAGASGAVPAFAPGLLGWMLAGLAITGTAAVWRLPAARVTLWFLGAILLQGTALWLLPRARGAETPYMAMKMIYLAVYPVAVLGAAGVGVVLRRVPVPLALSASAALVAALAAGLVAATRAPVPPPIVDADLDAAGRWAREHLPPSCVGYIVDSAEQAYWLHLAVMGQPRASARTADIDRYTANRAVGLWIEGAALPYAIARRGLLPGEVLGDADIVYDAGSAVVLRRRVAAASPVHC